MEENKIAILIDGAFFLQRFRKINNYKKSYPNIEEFKTIISEILTNINNKSSNGEINRLLRTFYYDCPPFDKEVKSYNGKTKINFKLTTGFKEQHKFICQLKKVEQLALRLGEISFDGWKIDRFTKKYKPDFKQKSVDMKIGLDMAWMAGKKTVNKMVLVTADSDFIAPMKLVRREGILVYLYPMGYKQLKSKLREHADFIIE